MIDFLHVSRVACFQWLEGWKDFQVSRLCKSFAFCAFLSCKSAKRKIFFLDDDLIRKSISNQSSGKTFFSQLNATERVELDLDVTLHRFWSDFQWCRFATTSGSHKERESERMIRKIIDYRLLANKRVAASQQQNISCKKMLMRHIPKVLRSCATWETTWKALLSY